MLEAVVIVALAVGVFFALRYMKRHPHSCSGNCAGCQMECKNREKD